jgi:hypothetical protein
MNVKQTMKKDEPDDEAECLKISLKRIAIA